MGNDTSGASGAKQTAKGFREGDLTMPFDLVKSTKPGQNVTKNAQRLGSKEIALKVLQDWILSARKLGLEVELWDMRPTENATGVAILGTFYCDKCGNLSIGDECLAESVVTVPNNTVGSEKVVES